MERNGPKTSRCGVPIIWVRGLYWDDGVWEGECVWCRRELAYLDPSTGSKD